MAVVVPDVLPPDVDPPLVPPEPDPPVLDPPPLVPPEVPEPDVDPGIVHAAVPLMVQPDSAWRLPVYATERPTEADPPGASVAFHEALAIVTTDPDCDIVPFQLLVTWLPAGSVKLIDQPVWVVVVGLVIVKVPT